MLVSEKMNAGWLNSLSLRYCEICKEDCTHMHRLQEESDNTAIMMCLLVSQKVRDECSVLILTTRRRAKTRIVPWLWQSELLCHPYSVSLIATQLQYIYNFVLHKWTCNKLNVHRASSCCSTTSCLDHKEIIVIQIWLMDIGHASGQSSSCSQEQQYPVQTLYPSCNQHLACWEPWEQLFCERLRRIRELLSNSQSAFMKKVKKQRNKCLFFLLGHAQWHKAPLYL